MVGLQTKKTYSRVSLSSLYQYSITFQLTGTSLQRISYGALFRGCRLTSHESFSSMVIGEPAVTTVRQTFLKLASLKASIQLKVVENAQYSRQVSIARRRDTSREKAFVLLILQQNRCVRTLKCELHVSKCSSHNIEWQIHLSSCM